MTLAGAGVEAVTSGMLYPVTGPDSGYGAGADGSISTLSERTQEPVTDALKTHVQSSEGWSLSTDMVWEFLRAGISLPLSIIEALADAILPFGIGDMLDLPHAFDTLETAFTNTFEFLGDLNPLDPDFNLADAATAFINLILSPVNLLAELVGGFLPGGIIPGLDASKIVSGLFSMDIIDGLTDFLDGVPILGDLVEAITGIAGGDLLDIGGWFDNLTAFLGGDVGDFGGSFDIGAIATSFASIVLDPIGFFANLVSGLVPGAQIPGLDASKITTGTFAQALVDGVTDIADTAFGWVAGFLNAFTGGSATAGTVAADPVTAVASVSNAAVSAAETALANSIALAQLQSQQDGGSNSGLYSIDDMERDTLATQTIDPGWAETFASSKTTNGYYACDGHEATFVHGSSPNSGQTIDYRRDDPADAETQTLFQKVSVVIGSFIGDTFSFGSHPGIKLRGRLNAAETEEVFVYVTTNGYARFGYKNGGSEILVGSAVFVGTPASASTWTLVCGAGTLRNFQLIKGTSAVHSWNDAGSLSAAVQGTNNGWGWSAEIIASSPALVPPNIAAITIADNAPATILGSYLSAYRASTSTINASGGAVLPDNTFDTLEASSPDIAWDATEGEATVSKDGKYQITMCARDTANMGGSTTTEAAIYVNGALRKRRVSAKSGSGVATFGPHPIYISESLYLEAGDIVRGGLETTAGTRTIIGDAGGTMTYFIIAKIGD